MSSDRFTTETITDVRPWTESLFSFRTTRDRGYRFVPGQFARIGVRDAATLEPIWRAYSIASASYDEHLEFFSVVVPGGAFTSRLATLREGDPILVERRSYGFLTTDRFENGRDLWMLATGTGLAPFLSILHEFETWESYENLVLVQSVRTQAELAYEDLIRGFEGSRYYGEFAHKLRYVRIVTRENVPGVLGDRVTKLLTSHVLEDNVGLALDHDRSRIMLCGNPEMVEDSRKLLLERGFRLSRRADPGHFATENYSVSAREQSAEVLGAILERASARGRAKGLDYSGEVTPTEAWQLHDAGAAVIVDVRTRPEWELVGRVADAPLVEWRRYGDSTPNSRFLEELAKVAGREDAILFLCRSGVRSHHAAEAAARAGFGRAFNVLEGFEGDLDSRRQRGALGGWRAAGLPWIQS